jgi:long-chain acyl-CoA synthetase
LPQNNLEQNMSQLPKVHQTVVHMLAAAANDCGDTSAVVYEDRDLSYIEYLRCVAGLAHKLQEYSGGQSLRGERVALICGNSLEMAIGTFAVHASGAQAVPVNPIYTKRELTHILGDSEPIAVIFDAEISAVVEPLLQEWKIAHGIEVGDAGERFDVWRDDISVTLPEMPIPEDLATLQYTGGTTGLPKGVIITHRQLSTNISQRESGWPTRQGEERVLCVMPLFHVYASSMALHLAVYCKSQLHILSKYRPDTVLKCIAEDRITILPVGPTIYQGLMSYEGFASTDFSSLRIAYSGSAPLPEETLKRWEEATDCPILEGYGQTEAGPVVSAIHEGTPAIVGSVGKPLAGTIVQIVDVETGSSILDAGEQGEIRVQGPQIMSGYRNRLEETKEALRDGWLYTGDIGELDGEGNLYIRDRKKDMVIVGGYNVYPREIDEVLFAHPDVSEAAAVGVPDEYRGEVIRACVTLREEANITSEDLLNYCAQELAKYKVPAEIQILEEVPKTTVGKIDKSAVRNLFRTI